MGKSHFYGELYCLKFVCSFIGDPCIWRRFLPLAGGTKSPEAVGMVPAVWGCSFCCDSVIRGLQILGCAGAPSRAHAQPGTAQEHLFPASLWEVLHLSQLFCGCECFRVLKTEVGPDRGTQPFLTLRVSLCCTLLQRIWDVGDMPPPIFPTPYFLPNSHSIKWSQLWELLQAPETWEVGNLTNGEIAGWKGMRSAVVLDPYLEEGLDATTWCPSELLSAFL